ncbi:hypothetical protein V6W80_17625 [Pseudomonas benzopyrenica]|uniref:Uncharacterized protein n=1 Tax=Pseudomonas benzopyrenica TaxID=2993566 RepID=A0ABZ2FNB6_9PSED
MMIVTKRKILAACQRRELVTSWLLWGYGTMMTLHVVADRLEDINELLQGLDTRSREFH